MKTDRISEIWTAIDMLENGDKIQIEKFSDHVFINTIKNDNINANGVDLSILNKKDWFYMETVREWLFKGNPFDRKDGNVSYARITGSLYISTKVCNRDDALLLRKATDSDLAPFFEKYPEYAPVKVGDIGIFYDSLEIEKECITNGELNIGSLESTQETRYKYRNIDSAWKNFFKVQPTETIAEIKERFLKQQTQK